MATEIKAPAFPESVSEGVIATWHKQAGEFCAQDELLVDIETDKVVLEIVAPAAGRLTEIFKSEDAVVASQEVIALFEEGAEGAATEETPASDSAPADEKESTAAPAVEKIADSGQVILSPAARKAAQELSVDPASVSGTGKDGRVTKEDIIARAKNMSADIPADMPVKKNTSAAKSSSPSVAPIELPADSAGGERIEKRVPMTRLRKRIAERLLQAQQNAAMLTTFNEVNLQPVMDLRLKYKDAFEKRHNTRLGFMSFFVKACAEALKRFPVVNASIDGSDIVYHGYVDIGVAVSSERGLVVPVLRNVENMGLAEIEATIREFGAKARDNKLSIEDMTGGTFTVSNGGVFGSMLSTPILNPPQSAILGMHAIQERPVAENGEVVIRPMMYLAVSYDHCLLDGKDAVSFLVTIKELLEDPARMLLDV